MQIEGETTEIGIGVRTGEEIATEIEIEIAAQSVAWIAVAIGTAVLRPINVGTTIKMIVTNHALRMRRRREMTLQWQDQKERAPMGIERATDGTCRRKDQRPTTRRREHYS